MTELIAPSCALNGVPMLERVIVSIEKSGIASAIAISADDPQIVSATPALAELSSPARGLLHFHRSASSPASSVADYFSGEGGEEPLFVTTGDHPLLSPEMIRYFVERGIDAPADFVVGMVPASVYRRRFPDQPRTFIPLRGERYSGANLFLLRTAQAAAVARFWTRAEAYRKTPWKLARVFGRTNLALFMLGRLDLDAALERASDVIGATIRAVELPYAEAALDVDKEADRVCAEAVFAERSLSPQA